MGLPTSAAVPRGALEKPFREGIVGLFGFPLLGLLVTGYIGLNMRKHSQAKPSE